MEYFNVDNEQYREALASPFSKSCFKIELIDYTEQQVLKDITPHLDTSGNITISYNQGTRASCTFTIIDSTGEFLPSADTNFFWILTKFRISVGLEYLEDTFWFNGGVFFVKNTSVDRKDNKITVNGVDKFGLLSNELGYNTLTTAYQIPSGNNIYRIIQDILMFDMGNGQVIDYIAPIVDPLLRDVVVPYDISKSSGSYLGDILIELGNILGANVFYNSNGALCYQSGTTDVAYSSYAPTYHFKDISRNYTNSTLNYNFDDTANVVTVTSANTSDKVYTYTAEDHNRLSPTAIEKIGRKEFEPIEVTSGWGQQNVEDYAKYKLNNLSRINTQINFESALIPHLKVDDVIDLTDEFLNYKQERFIIQSLTIPINYSGGMTVSCSNVASLPYYAGG